MTEALDAFQQARAARRNSPRARIRPRHSPTSAELAPKLRKDQIIIINLSGRGDKDCQEVARLIAKD